MNESSKFVPALRFKALMRFYDPVVRLNTMKRVRSESLRVLAPERSQSRPITIRCLLRYGFYLQ